jgi:multidrug efflux pump subunit AcrB
MNFLAKFFIENHRFTIIMTLFVMLFGVTGLMRLNSESFPSVNIGAVLITTNYPGATAEDIETKITKPLEEEIQKVSGLKLVKSTSQAGFSTIVTEVDIDRYPVSQVIADLQRAVDRASGLPTDLLDKPRFTEIKSDEFPVIELAVIGANDNRQRDLIADQLKEDLKDNKKISSVNLDGYSDRQFNIFLNRDALLEKHVSISEVYAALSQRNITIPAGEIKGATEQKLVRIEGKARSAAELESIIVRSNFSGKKIQLSDIARIEDGSSEPRTLASYRGQPATFLVIAKKGGADIMDLAKEVEDLLATYRTKYQGQVELKVFSNEGLRVGNRLAVLTSNGWQGILLVVIFLQIFMPGRVGVMTALSLPLALAATLGYMQMIGMSLNTITIIALVIAIGMLVDNAVVISENFTRLRNEGLSAEDALLKTVRDLWAPVTATGLTTIAAFLPMMVTTGVMGQFIKGIPIVVSVALLISLIESFFLLPTRLRLVGYKPQAQGEGAKLDFFDRWLVPAFERLMTRVVEFKYTTFIVISILIVGTIVMLAFVNKVNLFPTDQTEIYVGRYETSKGTRLESTILIGDAVSVQIAQVLGDKIAHVVATAGSSATDPSDPKGEVGSNVGIIRIFVTRETQDTVATQDILNELRSIKRDDARLSFEPLANGPPVGDPVSITFRSNNAKELDAVAQHIKNRIAQEKGIFDAKVNDVFGDNEITIEVDFEQIARLGLSLSDVGVNVRTAIAGITTSDVNLDNRKVDYFLQFDSRFKGSIGNISGIKISDRSGNLIPLSSIAKLHEKSGSPQIKRYDFKRAKTVTANLDDNLMTSLQANALIKKEFETIKDQYKDVGITFGGEAEKTNESVESLFNALILSMVGIFALMVLIFRSYINPFIIMTTIPLGLTGVSFAFWAQGIDFSFMAIIGVIGLGGIIVNSGIILISFIEQMRTESNLPLATILAKTSSMRLRSVLVTSLTTISGLAPTAYGIGGSDEFIIPMAMALGWGLTTGTIFTLIWVPPAYAIVESLTSKVRRVLGRD